jgi:serine O-acetyltransferase
LLKLHIERINDVIMAEVVKEELVGNISNAIDALSNPKSYEQVYHRPHLNEEMISVESIKEIMDLIKEVIFPGYFGNNALSAETIKFHIGVRIEKISKLLKTQIKRGYCFSSDVDECENCENCKFNAESTTIRFLNKLPLIREKLAQDVHAMYLYDPAARGYGEIIFAYPAIKAITNYRVAHELFLMGIPIIPRIITEMAHSDTGIDIHPGAHIGDNFVIDHGTGVVIGETCIIGNNVKLFQGVTLGARSFKLDGDGNPIKGIARHPIVEDDVTIYSGATVLGRVTIGKGSMIGGNVWLTQDLPANSRVVQGRPRENLFEMGGGI